MEDKKRNITHLQKKYQTRITLAKTGQEAYQGKDFKNAIKFYNLYLKLLADINDVKIENLSPKFFDRETQSSEVFLISQIYWDLAKLYDMSSNMRREMLHCLNKYIEFSMNYPFQVVNAESLRRYLRKSKCQNQDAFQEAYKKLHVSSKMCFVATYTFGFEHPKTEQFRHFKLFLLKTKFGEKLVEIYYQYSPKIVIFLENNYYCGRFCHKVFLKPSLSLFAKLFLPTIIKK